MQYSATSLESAIRGQRLQDKSLQGFGKVAREL